MTSTSSSTSSPAPASAGDISLGIDIGGTFTDVVCATPEATHILKVATTRANPALAVIGALGEIERRFGVAPSRITRFAHGTTIATNAVIERKGARVGLVTTEGFRDILEIGRQIRRQMYDLNLKPETPGWLAPGARRVEIAERIGPHGEVLAHLDATSLEQALARLAAEKVEAVAVVLLFAFLEPAHEQAVAAAIARAMPGVPVSLSSEVDPSFREYERTVVTTFDAYVKPVVTRYLADMARELARHGVGVPLQVMQSRGGLADSAIATQRPVRLFLSGPAAGALGAAAAGREAGIDDLITIDVGGTSSDIALITGGRVAVKAETEIAGYPVRVPTLDVTTLGAGGGSLAWLDAAGGMRVGPQSAGSEPGPACYGRGGRGAPVTDPTIDLGYLDPAYFVGGAMLLDPELARRAIADRIAGPLAMSVEQAALGMHRIANAHMADGIRLVSINRGYDPREFTLVPLGGAGGLHAAALADELGLQRILVPRYPGVLAAAGLLAAPIEHEVTGAFHGAIATTAMDEVRRALAGLDAKAAALMAREQTTGLRGERETVADVGYAGQSHFIAVPLVADAPDALARLYRDFEAAHERINGHKTGAPARIVNLRVVHRAHQPAARAGATAPSTSGRSLKGRRGVVFAGNTTAIDTAIHDRARLAAGETISGPAIIEQIDTTTLVPPGWRATVIAGAALDMRPTTR